MYTDSRVLKVPSANALVYLEKKGRTDRRDGGVFLWEKRMELEFINNCRKMSPQQIEHLQQVRMQTVVKIEVYESAVVLLRIYLKISIFVLLKTEKTANDSVEFFEIWSDFQSRTDSRIYFPVNDEWKVFSAEKLGIQNRPTAWNTRPEMNKILQVAAALF